MKKISVVIPCYNGQKTLHRCLDSVLQQTYKNIEVIVVDDGSQDDSALLVQQYAQQDNRLILLKKKNGGVGSARNKGLSRASGDYIQFVDIDDYLEHTMLEKLADSLEKTNSDIAVCRFSHCCFKPFLPAGLYNMREKRDFSDFYLDFFTFNVPWNKLYRREIITSNFDESIKIFEDGLFVLANLKNAGQIVVLEDELYHYYNAASDGGSAVNNFLKSKFWKTKQGYWYKFNEIKPLFDALLMQCGHTEKILEYARSFDMAFWELIKLIDSGCDKKICSLEMSSVFNQPNFIQSVKSRGFDYRGASRKTVNSFVSICFKEVCRFRQTWGDTKTQPIDEPLEMMANKSIPLSSTIFKPTKIYTDTTFGPLTNGQKPLKGYLNNTQTAADNNTNSLNLGILFNKIVQIFCDTCLPVSAARMINKQDIFCDEGENDFLGNNLMAAKN